uniref:VWFA domain-containing protein n=1 Tax=Plectus sambesii TaxID=2011161 RepID=A0A914X614_9BILA
MFAVFDCNSNTAHWNYASNYIFCTDYITFCTDNIPGACHHSYAIVNIPLNYHCMHGSSAHSNPTDAMPNKCDFSHRRALQKTEDPTTFTGGMGCVQKAVVLFTSTSIDADIATAQQFADAIKKNGPLIIVAMGPNASAPKLSPLSSPTPVIQWPDYDNVPVNLASNIIQAICPSYSTATPVQPTGSTPAITSAAPTTSSAPVTTAMPSSTFPPTTVAATTPPPTVTGPFPCQRNIIILFDSSNGMNANQYLNQTTFISHQLFTSSWTFDQTNVAVAAYDDTNPFNFRVTGAFGNIKNLKQAQNALHISQGNDVASITTALNLTTYPATFPDAPPNVKQSTVLFASTSVHADIQGAVQYANQITANGPLAVVAMGPSASVDELSSLTPRNQIFAWLDYNNVPADLVSNIIQTICPPS